MRQIKLPIDGTAKTCQKSAVPCKPGENGNTDYPEGVCPHFRQYPNGNDPVCLIFQKDVRTPRSLEVLEPGLTKRLSDCCVAEKDAGKDGFIQINIVAGERFCETKPIIKIQAHTDPATGVHIKEGPDPWISLTSGYETIYYPEEVCGNYVNFPNGSSWCRIYHQKIFRNAEGLTPRLFACLQSEAEQKK